MIAFLCAPWPDCSLGRLLWPTLSLCAPLHAGGMSHQNMGMMGGYGRGMSQMGNRAMMMGMGGMQGGMGPYNNGYNAGRYMQYNGINNGGGRYGQRNMQPGRYGQNMALPMGV